MTSTDRPGFAFSCGFGLWSRRMRWNDECPADDFRRNPVGPDGLDAESFLLGPSLGRQSIQ